MTEKKLTRAEELKADGYTVSPCKGCGKMMVWGRTPTGSWLPLDPVPPVYAVVKIRDFEGRERPEVVRNMMAFVSHFTTCAQVNRFSKGGKA
jgi:hypothetical protein